MSIDALSAPLVPDNRAAGAWLYERVAEWYPLDRSITGNGLRKTLDCIGEHIPLTTCEIPTGTAVFDWTIPREWNVREAYIKTPSGERIADFREHNLHVLGYSVPVHEKVSLETLREHVFTLPDKPEWVPYRNSYYKENWGFCMAHRQLESLEDGEYEVHIDSTLEDGSLTYAECYLPGEREDEFLLSAHACHPSIANDNLSGLAIAAWLARALQDRPHRYSYRFVFAPGTIGAIAWLARNEAGAQVVRHGLVLACLGDSGQSTYKRSRRGDAEIDLAAQYVLSQSGQPHAVLDFSPYGYDERQYCSPGFDLPMGCFMRTPPGHYPEYHTSADNLELVQADCLADSLAKVAAVIAVIEGNGRYRNLNPKCEPQLGKRGLYSAIGGRTDTRDLEMAMLWALNLSDGGNSLLDIAVRSGYRFDQIHAAAGALEEAGLLSPV